MMSQALSVNELYCPPNYPIPLNLLAMYLSVTLHPLVATMYTFRYRAVH